MHIRIHLSQSYIDGQLCFYRQSFADPVKPRRSTTGSMELLRGTNKATWHVKLLPTTVYIYQVDYGSFCALLRTQCWYCSLLASHPPPTPTPPPPTCSPPINFICDITAVDKNHLKIQQCQLDCRFSYKSIAI